MFYVKYIYRNPLGWSKKGKRGYFPRSGNKVADGLAKRPRVLKYSETWVECIPKWICSLVEDDCSSFASDVIILHFISKKKEKKKERLGVETGTDLTLKHSDSLCY